MDTEPIFYYTHACFLQKSPQVALNPHCFPSSVKALQRNAACSAARPFLAGAEAQASLGLGGSFVSMSLWRPATRAKDFSRAKMAVSAIFSASSILRVLRAALNTRCQRSLPRSTGARAGRGEGAFGGGRARADIWSGVSFWETRGSGMSLRKAIFYFLGSRLSGTQDPKSQNLFSLPMVV